LTPAVRTSGGRLLHEVGLRGPVAHLSQVQAVRLTRDDPASWL